MHRGAAVSYLLGRRAHFEDCFLVPALWCGDLSHRPEYSTIYVFFIRRSYGLAVVSLSRFISPQQTLHLPRWEAVSVTPTLLISLQVHLCVHFCFYLTVAVTSLVAFPDFFLSFMSQSSKYPWNARQVNQFETKFYLQDPFPTIDDC